MERYSSDRIRWFRFGLASASFGTAESRVPRGAHAPVDVPDTKQRWSWMRIFVAGASGAIGRPLVRQLIEAGHQVTGTTRREARAEKIRAAGATAVVCDVFDTAALEVAVKEASPEVVVNQLTSLPEDFNPRKIDYTPTNRVRQ